MNKQRVIKNVSIKESTNLEELPMDQYDVSAENLSQATVFDALGEKKVLAELWSQRPAVLVFVRHFG